jgi:hypothetical protein
LQRARPDSRNCPSRPRTADSLLSQRGGGSRFSVQSPLGWAAADAWINESIGIWENAGNWSEGVVPNAGTQVDVDDGIPEVTLAGDVADGIDLDSESGSVELAITEGTLDNTGELNVAEGEGGTPEVAIGYSSGSSTILQNDNDSGTNGFFYVATGSEALFNNSGGTAYFGSFVNKGTTLSLALVGATGHPGTTNIEGTYSDGTATYAVYRATYLMMDHDSTLNIDSAGQTQLTGSAYITSGIINNNDGGKIVVPILYVGSDSAGPGIIHGGTGALSVDQSLIVSGGGVLDLGTTSSTAGINISGSGYAGVGDNQGTLSAPQVTVSGSGTLDFAPSFTPATFSTTSLNTSTSGLVIVGTGDLIITNTLSMTGSSIVSVGTTASDTTPGLSVTGSGVVLLAIGPSGTIGSLTAPAVNVSGAGTLALGSGALSATNISVSTSGYVSVNAGLLVAGQSLLVLGTASIVTVGNTATAPGINVGGSGVMLVGTGSFVGTLSAPQISVSGSGELEMATGALVATNVTISTSGYVSVASGTLIASQSLSVLGTLGVIDVGTTSTTPGVNVAGLATLIVGSAGLTGTLTTPALNVSGTGSLKLGTSGSITVTTNQFNISDSGNIDLGGGTLQINYAGGTSPIANVVTALTAGYNGGHWNGTSTASIVSSSVSSLYGEATIYGIGYADGADGMTNVPSGQILVTPALVGDAKLMGNVNFGDFQILAQFFGSAGTWDEGNFRYGSTVNFGDFQQLSQNFGQSSSLGGAADLRRSRPGPSFGSGRHLATPDAATVTLNIAASGGSWTAYANDSTGDNAGIASFDIDVAGSGDLTVNTSFNDAPADAHGFVEFPSNGNNDSGSGGDGIGITAGQNTLGTHGIFQGFGQSSGTDGTVSWTQTDLGVDIASGTYSGTYGTLTVDVDSEGFIQTLDIVSDGLWSGPGNIDFASVDAGSVTIGGDGDDFDLRRGASFGVQSVPEPGAGVILLGAGIAAFRRRRPAAPSQSAGKNC